MLRVDELKRKTCKELREIAGGLGIAGRHKMTKEELAYEIIDAETKRDAPKKRGLVSSFSNPDESDESDESEGSPEVTTATQDGTKNLSNRLQETGDKVLQESSHDRKMRYIESAEIGTIIAFKANDGRVKSAMIINKSTSSRRFKLETKYGAIYLVSYDDVVWVRTGTRWPRGVYMLLKGITEDENTVEEDKDVGEDCEAQGR